MLSIEESLKQAGLTGNGSKVYLELLRRGSINGSQLANKVGLDRTLTYQILNNLMEKGLVNYIVKEHKKYFSATNPENLLRAIKEKEDFIQNLIPQLKKIEKVSEIEQAVEIYEGKAGLKVLFEEMVKAKDVCFFGGTGKSYDILKWEIRRIEKLLKNRGINGRGIAEPQFRGKSWTKLKKLKVRYLKGAKSYDTAFDILDNEKVTIHCLAQDKPLIIIIKNKFVALTLKSYFEFMWKQAKP